MVRTKKSVLHSNVIRKPELNVFTDSGLETLFLAESSLDFCNNILKATCIAQHNIKCSSRWYKLAANTRCRKLVFDFCNLSYWHIVSPQLALCVFSHHDRLTRYLGMWSFTQQLCCGALLKEGRAFLPPSAVLYWSVCHNSDAIYWIQKPCFDSKCQWNLSTAYSVNSGVYKLSISLSRKRLTS